MGTAITTTGDLGNLEENLVMLAPRFDAVLGNGTSMDSKRLIQTLLISCERSPKLMKCTRSSLIMGAMTFATLRLPIDGASGQGFLLPFAGVAQPAIGYKGYNTIAGRSGFSINAGTVREGDKWDYQEGSGGFVMHKRVLDSKAPIIAFWAVAEAKERPPLVSILGIGEVNAIMQKSPAVRAKAETPWNDATIGFPAMGQKSARRRLARGMPWDVDEGRFLLAARMEEAFEEQGKRSYLEGPRMMIEGEAGNGVFDVTTPEPPKASDLMAPRLSPHETALRKLGDDAAAKGSAMLYGWWMDLNNADKAAVKDYQEKTLKPAAIKADAVNQGE